MLAGQSNLGKDTAPPAFRYSPGAWAACTRPVAFGSLSFASDESTYFIGGDLSIHGTIVAQWKRLSLST